MEFSTHTARDGTFGVSRHKGFFAKTSEIEGDVEHDFDPIAALGFVAARTESGHGMDDSDRFFDQLCMEGADRDGEMDGAFGIVGE